MFGVVAGTQNSEKSINIFHHLLIQIIQLPFMESGKVHQEIGS